MSKLFDDASLAMIPSAYKDGKLYSIRPTDGSGDFTFSRGSNLAATRVDVNGLIEKGRENTILYSNDFSNAAWTHPSSSFTSGFVGYDGSNNAWKWSSTSTGTAQITQSHGTSGILTLSLYAKAGTIDVLKIWIGLDVQFNLTTGVSSYSQSKMTNVGNGWYRCEVYTTSYPTLNPFFTATSAGDYIYIQDAQVEKGLVATDYIETGASTAQAGILEDMPRLDYSGSCPALLLEPQRTNSYVHSEYFSGAGWTMGRSAVTYNDATSPEGLSNAVKWQMTSDTGAHYLRQSKTSTDTWSVSIFVKKGNYRYVGLRCAASNAAFDLDTGTFSSGSGYVEALENGWYRIALTETANGTFQYYGIYYANSDATERNDATGDEYYHIYGAQLEIGSYPTSYIPTYGSSVTRSEDSASDTDISSYYVQNGSTLFFEIECDGEVDESNVTAILRLGTSVNTTRVSFLQGYNRIYSTWYDGNTGALGTINNLDAGSRVKVAVQIANDGIARMNGGVNGIGNTIRDYTLSSENYTRLEIYRSSRFKQLAIFPTLLTASEMEALTTL